MVSGHDDASPKGYGKTIFNYVLICCALSFANRGMPTPFLPLVVQDNYGQPATMVGLVMSCYPVAAFFATPIAGSLSRKTENIVHLHAFTLLFMGIASGLFVTCDFIHAALGGSAALAAVIVFRVMQGLANALFLGAHNSLVARTFKLKELPYVVAMLEVAMAAGSQAGRLSGGFLYEAGGFGTPFLVVFVILSAMSLLGFSMKSPSQEVELITADMKQNEWQIKSDQKISEVGKEGYNEYKEHLPKWSTQMKRSSTSSLSRGVHTVSWKSTFAEYHALEQLEPSDVNLEASRGDSVHTIGSSSSQIGSSDVPWSQLLLPRVVLGGCSVFSSMMLMGFYDAALPQHLITHLGGISMSTLSMLISVRTMTYMTTAYVSAQILHKHLMSLEGLIATGAVSCTIGLMLVAPQPFVVEGEELLTDDHPTLFVWGIQIASLAFSSFGQALTLMPTLPLMQSEVRNLGTKAGEQVATMFIALMTLGEAVGPLAGGALVQTIGFTKSALVMSGIFPLVLVFTLATYDKTEIQARAGEGEHLQHAGDFTEVAFTAYSQYNEKLPRWSKNLRRYKRSATSSLSRGRHTVMWHSTFSPYYCLG